MAPVATEDTPLVTKKEDAGDAAKFRELQQKWFMRSKTGKWTGFLLCCVTQYFVITPVLGWQTLQQNMIDEGCPYSKSQLDEMTYWGNGLATAAFLPIGIVFDHYGPWIVGVVGVFVGGVSICALALGLIFSDSLWWLVGLGYVIDWIMTYTNKFSLYSYLWIMQESPFTIIALCQASDALAEVTVVVCVWLSDSYGVTTGAFLMGLGLLTCASTIIVWLALPTNAEAKLLKRYTFSRADEGKEKPSIDDIFGTEEPPENRTVAEIVRGKVLDVIDIACRQHPYDVWLFFVNDYCLLMVCMTLIYYQYAYYLTIFSEEKSLQLVVIFPLIFGFVGPVVSFFMGRLFDMIGIGLTISCGNCICTIFFILNAIPSDGSIIAAMVVYASALAYTRMIVVNFSQIYAPPELLGTLTGCICCLLGVGQIVFAELLDLIASAIFSGYWQYSSQFMFWWFGLLLTGSYMLFHFNFIHSFKKRGVSSIAELREFQSKSKSEEPMKDSTSH